MPRYYFHTEVGSDTIRDPEGEVLPDADAAWRAARLLILQLLDGGDRDLLTAVLVVEDGAGETVFEFPFAEAIEPEAEPRLH